VIGLGSVPGNSGIARNDSEKAYLDLEAREAASRILDKYKDEGQFLVAISQLLRQEGGRLLYAHERSEHKDDTPSQRETSKIRSIFDAE